MTNDERLETQVLQAFAEPFCQVCGMTNAEADRRGTFIRKFKGNIMACTHCSWAKHIQRNANGMHEVYVYEYDDNFSNKTWHWRKEGTK